MDTIGRMPNNSSTNKTEARWGFPDKTKDMVKTWTNCLIFILTTVILGSEHCFIYKQIASDLIVLFFNETKPLHYLQLDLPIQIIRKISKRMFKIV